MSGKEELNKFYELLDNENIKQVLPQIEKGIHDELNAIYGKEKAIDLIQNNKMLLKLNAFMNGESNIPFESRKIIIPKVYFSNLFSEGCLKGLKMVSQDIFFMDSSDKNHNNKKNKTKCMMVVFKFMIMKLQEKDQDSESDCNQNNQNTNINRTKKWFMCDITFFCKVEDNESAKIYCKTSNEINKQLIEFKHKQSELMKHKSGVERKKVLTENEKRRVDEYEREIKSIEQIEIEKIDSALFYTRMIYLSHNFYIRDISIFSQMFKIDKL